MDASIYNCTWKPFDECCILTRGDYITKKNAIKGNIPVILGGQEPAYYINKSNHTGKAIVISRSGASAGFVSYWDEPIFVTDGFIIEPKEGLDFKFLYYYFKKLQSELNATKKGGGVPHITGDDIRKILIPVPRLEVQHRIVHILDNFTELAAELTEKLAAELTARKMQYEYYRERLLDKTGKQARIISISELGKWSGGKTPSMAKSSYWDNGTIPWLSSKDMKTSTLSDTQDHITEKAIREASMTVYPTNSIAIVTRSGILKHTFPVSYVPFQTTINQDIKILVVNENVLPRYAFHVIQGKGKDILAKAKKQGGTVDSLDFQKVLAYKIPLPSLAAQEQLAKILDNFDAICSDLVSSLPAEIEFRQKQYEYYRDKLLTFKEKIC